MRADQVDAGPSVFFDSELRAAKPVRRVTSGAIGRVDDGESAIVGTVRITVADRARSQRRRVETLQPGDRMSPFGGMTTNTGESGVCAIDREAAVSELADLVERSLLAVARRTVRSELAGVGVGVTSGAVLIQTEVARLAGLEVRNIGLLMTPDAGERGVSAAQLERRNVGVRIAGDVLDPRAGKGALIDERKRVVVVLEVAPTALRDVAHCAVHSGRSRDLVGDRRMTRRTGIRE